LSAGSKNINKITPQERRFFKAYVKGGNITRAYLKIRPDVTESSAASLGTRMLQRIKKKADFDHLLEAGGLGMTRLIAEVEKGLNAETTKYWQDEVVGVHEDNATQQRARELLADLLGVRKQKLDLHHSAEESIVDILTAAHGEREEC